MKNNFLNDLLKEARDGKFSTKKFWGHICMILVSVTYVLDGWHFYKINEHLFDSVLLAGTTLLGISVIASIFNKNNKKDDLE